MPGLTVRELAVLFEAQEDCELYVIEREHAEKPTWEIHVVLEKQGKRYVVQGLRGRPRGWKNFERVLSFIRETCPRAKKFIVTLA